MVDHVAVKVEGAILPFEPRDENVAAKGSPMSKPTLSRRLFLLVLGAMVPLVAILFFNLYEIKSAKERDVHAEAFRLGQLAALEIQRIVRFLKDRGIGVLITDHNVRETLGICDHAYIISEGSVLAAGTPDQIVADESVRRVYLGENFRM